MVNAEQLIEKLDGIDNNKQISIEELEKNITKLDSNEFQELGTLLIQKDKILLGAFTYNGKNIIKEWAKDNYELTGINTNKLKMYNLCENIGIFGLIKVEKAIKEYNDDGDEELNYFSKNAYYAMVSEILGFDNDKKVLVENGEIKNLKSLTKEDFTEEKKKAFYTLNQKIHGQKCNRVLNLCSGLKNEIIKFKGNKDIEEKLAEIVEIENQIKILDQFKNHINEILTEGITLEQLVRELGLPQLKGLQLPKGMKIIKKDGRTIMPGYNEEDIMMMGIVDEPSNKTYFNYELTDGKTHISITFHKNINGYKITGYGNNTITNPLFGGYETPLREQWESFYNVLGYRGNFDNEPELSNIDRIGLSEKVKKILTTPLNEEGELALISCTQEEIDAIIYILTGKIKFESKQGIINIKNIKTLEIGGSRGGKINYLPKEIGMFTELINLRISGNTISTLPLEISNLKKLLQLHLHGNTFESIPTGVYELDNLVELSLWWNNITFISPDIGNLKNLKTLNLSNNKIETIPNEISKLENLEYLDLGDNEIIELPETIGNLSKLKSIGIGNNKIRDFPKMICKMSNLEGLDMSRNNISSIPNEIKNLNKIKYIGLSGNQFIGFPTNICDLTTLEKVDLTGWGGEKKIIRIPKEIGKLTNLKSLNLQENKIEYIPNEIRDLINLGNLNLESNQISSMPDIRHIKGLKHGADLKYNPITKGSDEEELSGGDISENPDGEYADELGTEKNPALDIIASMPGMSNLSSFDHYDVGNYIPGEKSEKNKVLIESIEPPLRDNYRGAVFDIGLTTKMQIKGKSYYKKNQVK